MFIQKAGLFMYKFPAIILTFISLILILSCVSVKAVKPGCALSLENGYIAAIFANKREIISFGKKSVYMVLRNTNSGKIFYLPFGSGNELRLVKVKPGNYQIKDFVYLSGIGSVEGRDAIKKTEKLLHRIPQNPGTTIISASFPENYIKDFSVGAGQIVYTGSYLWKNKLSFDQGAVTIERNLESNEVVFSAIKKEHAHIPESMTLLSLIE